MHRNAHALLATLLLFAVLPCVKPAHAQSIAAGSAFTVAIKSTGTLWTWGANARGQLGDGSTAQINSPGQIATSTTFTSVAAGSDFALAISSSGALWAWGDNTNGQLGYTTPPTFSATPTQVSTGPTTTTGATWTQVAAGSNFSAAIGSDGSLWTWGNNTSGQLGNGVRSGTNTSTAPTQVRTPASAASGTTWTAVAAGGDFIVALRIRRHALGLGGQ